ncbi:hypothetical protein Gotri_001054, partial [Gossypium trilobum]|nr:hypothetical protein [Gossypium trilobum]
ISIANADECTGNGGSKFGYPIVVDKSDGGNFTSVQSAIDSIPQENHQWVKVQINPGKDRSVTTITFDAHNRTDESATFTSMADNIVAKGITFKNSYNHPLLLKHALSERKVLGVLQAVAARILGDKYSIFECGFLGLQDTLWDASGRHYFIKCHIEGAAGFIFGSGQYIYHINVTTGALFSQYPYGYITAQGQGSSDDTSGVIFQETTMNADVVPQGWDAWKFPGKEYVLN